MKTHDTNGRHLTAAQQEVIRIRATQAVVDQQRRPSEVVAQFGVGRTSLHRWIKIYRRKGLAGLQGQQRGRPPLRGRALNRRQENAIRRAVEERDPDQLKLPFALWTRQAVQQLITKRYGITLTLKSVGDYLRRWGMTPQKPKKRAYEQCPKQVQQWLDHEYPKIEKQAKKQGGIIHWGDETGLRSDHTAGRSYSPKGQTPVLSSTGQRFSCHAITTVTNAGQLAFKTFKGRFNGAVFLDFLSRLIRHAGRKVFLIIDGHPVHRSKKVKQWLAEHVDQIEVFELPGYSPQLNPDEYLNQDIKANVFKQERPRNVDQMRGLLHRYLRNRQRQPQIVRNYFLHPAVRYAAA